MIPTDTLASSTCLPPPHIVAACVLGCSQLLPFLTPFGTPCATARHQPRGAVPSHHRVLIQVQSRTETIWPLMAGRSARREAAARRARPGPVIVDTRPPPSITSAPLFRVIVLA
eukprot:scaffold36314_cov31-Tisochrysis_lutea.AAC.4